MQWTAEATSAMGVTERPFTVDREGDSIPGVLWTPTGSAGPLPFVLLGHGGQAHKKEDLNLSIARRFVRREGLAVVAIDAIEHGERGPITPDDDTVYRALWKRPDTVDRMIADWKAVLDEVSELPQLDAGAVTYWGISMGTMLGLPLVAAEPRIRAAVLGLCGFTGSSAERGGLGDRHRADAPNVTCPLLFLVQLDDERFGPDGAVALFQLLGASDKRLYAYPGLHGDLPQEGMDASRAFLARAVGR